jgi:hypothetical protein
MDCAYLINQEVQEGFDVTASGAYAYDRDDTTLGYHFDNFHTTLPFTEAERHWLVFTMYVSGEAYSSQAAHESTETGEVGRLVRTTYDAGRFREIRGRDLLDAWWAWRRDVFEFEEQGGIDYAREALRGMAEILVPQVPRLPYHELLRGDVLKETRRFRKIEREASAAIGARRQQTPDA